MPERPVVSWKSRLQFAHHTAKEISLILEVPRLPLPFYNHTKDRDGRMHKTLDALVGVSSRLFVRPSSRPLCQALVPKSSTQAAAILDTHSRGCVPTDFE
jgi:hypothetical protein